jgi:nucleoside-diphosphate-sugar epimerase
LVRRAVALPQGIEPINADLITGAGLDAALVGASTVIHLAGVTKALQPAGYYAGNAKASENLARAAARAGARFIHVSSLAASGPSPSGTPVNEGFEPKPISHYGKSKLAAEQAVRAALPEAVIVRPPVVYGPRETGVFQIFQSVARGLVLRIAGDHWFSMIYVHDLVAGLLMLLRRPDVSGRTYFLSHADPVSWSDLDSTAARIMNRHPRVITVPLSAAYTVGFLAEIWAGISRNAATISRDKIAEAACPAWVCDPSRAAAEFGFEAQTSLADGLRTTLSWYKEAGWLKY